MRHPRDSLPEYDLADDTVCLSLHEHSRAGGAVRGCRVTGAAVPRQFSPQERLQATRPCSGSHVPRASATPDCKCPMPLGSGIGMRYGQHGCQHASPACGLPTRGPVLVGTDWNTVATWFRDTIRWVVEGMAGGYRAVRRLTGRASVCVDSGSTAWRIESSATISSCQANLLSQPVRGVSGYSAIRARGRTSAENPHGTDFLRRASWIQLAGMTGTSQLRRRMQSRPDTIDHSCGRVSNSIQSKNDQTFRQVGGSRCNCSG